MASDRSATPDLSGAWVRTLYRWWEHYNRDYLRDALRRPLIELRDSRQQLGSWEATVRRITVSRPHLLEDPWSEVMDTLRHEMAHQYAGEVLDAVDEPPHGPAFREACRRLRCEPRPKTRPGPQGSPQDERVIRLVKKLLSLADSPNEHEAQAAIDKAQRLLLQYNIELVDADGVRDFGRRRLGSVKGRHAAWELWLAMILNEFFFVEVLWARSYESRRDREGTVLEVYGTPTNLEMAQYVHDYLAQLLTRLWDEYRARRGLGDNRERMRYFAGVLQGFHDKLKRQQAAASSNDSTELVWHGDGRLHDFYRYHNPHIVTRQSGGVAASEAFHHGVEEGQRVQLRRPVAAAHRFGGLLEGGGR